MKIARILSLVLALLMLAVCFAACGEKKEEKMTIKLWVSTTKGVDKFTEQQVAAFKALHPEYDFDVVIETVGEDSAATEVLKDLGTAPDVYSFAQDQISRLVLGGALAPLGVKASEEAIANNDAGSVGAATVGDKIYAYPMTSDNGYYLYYDSSIVSDEQAKSVEGIIQACKDKGVKFAYAGDSGFYTAAFFFAQPEGGGDPLCVSSWDYSADGKVVGLNDTINAENPNALIAIKGMTALMNSGAWVSSASEFNGTGALITGIWEANAAAAVYGDNLKATKLPTFTVDGKTYQMGSFSGYKLMGVKPQTDETKAKICTELAEYLTSGEVQLERYYDFQWGPSNLEAKANQDVQDNALLKALYQQQAYAVPQGPIPNDWWTEFGNIGANCKKAGLTDAELLAVLATYSEKVNAMVAK